MLPSARRYLVKGGYSKGEASWILLGSFVAGFVGIQILSRLLHHFIPSHVEDCDHTHDHDEAAHHKEVPSRSQTRSRAASHNSAAETTSHDHVSGQDKAANEVTPLLAQPDLQVTKNSRPGKGPSRPVAFDRRPSMAQVKTGIVAFVQNRKADCDKGDNACFGYSDPCQRSCTRSSSLSRRATGTLSRTPTTILADTPRTESPRPASSHSVASTPTTTTQHHHDVDSSSYDIESQQQQQHHHHVAENPFLSIGLQTSVAIAVHKLPEGFLTYATNHANPALGFSVFMALFVNNISEGFSLALPLYLALGSRFKAFAWAACLGGLSQPFGAGLAALWFHIAGNVQGADPGSAVYGTMFAITAGIMASVALSLFSESLALCHDRNLCVGCAFGGMVLMGVSMALTA